MAGAREQENDLKSEVDAMSFEAALAELEEIVSQLEEGDLSLGASLALFERGQLLAEHCRSHLESATLRVEKLTEFGEIVEIEMGE